MIFDLKIHHRKSIRLRGYDYSQDGLYFVTLCTQNRLKLFGEVADGEMRMNEAGKTVLATWEQIPAHYSGVEIDLFTVMPNHVHGIIKLVPTTRRGCPESNVQSPVGAGPRACPDSPRACPKSAQPENKKGQPHGVAPTGISLPDLVRRYKTLTTKIYTDGVKQSGWQPYPAKLWQRNYYEHIIRNEETYIKIAEYIQTNPGRWEEDIYHG